MAIWRRGRSCSPRLAPAGGVAVGRMGMPSGGGGTQCCMPSGWPSNPERAPDETRFAGVRYAHAGGAGRSRPASRASANAFPWTSATPLELPVLTVRSLVTRPITAEQLRRRDRGRRCVRSGAAGSGVVADLGGRGGAGRSATCPDMPERTFCRRDGDASVVVARIVCRWPSILSGRLGVCSHPPP